MISNILKKIVIFLILLSISTFNSNSAEKFNFDITEIEISDNGNKIKGLKRGTINSDDNLIIKANEFDYDKTSNILKLKGNVIINDITKNYTIFAEEVNYNKNNEIIKTEKNSKLIQGKQGNISANKFEFRRIDDLLIAKDNVKVVNNIQKYEILADEINYFRNIEKIISKGKTEINFQSKFIFNSQDINFLIRDGLLNSNKKTKIQDSNFQVYFVDKFKYNIKDKILNGKNILIINNYNLPKSDQLFFADAIIDIENKTFNARDIELKLHKNIFDNSENDPRLKGVSSVGKPNYTEINKGIFTSCKERDGCPPWSIQAEKIKHNKTKKQLIYDNAVLKVYDFPILYFPKFFHPDPTVKRQSGFLQPKINNSNILGNSFSIPYYHVISNNKDFTFSPTIFEDSLFMFQNEYRQVNKNSNLITNFGIVDGYKSSIQNKKNSIFHIFTKFELDLNFDKFNSSNLIASFEKVSNDTFLKVFDSNIQADKIKPQNSDVLNNEVKLTLDHTNYFFDAGIQVYEDLRKKSSDRYQYILPYYNFNKTISSNYFGGSVELSSNGNNDLNNTNEIKSKIINNVVYSSPDFITSLGLKNDFEINLKNLNSLGKNNNEYKSSPQIELMSMINFNSALPMIKENNYHKNYLTPKISLKFNPHDMKNYSTSDRKIGTENIFNNDRLGLEDTLETGKSLTFGVDYKREKIDDINKFFEMKLATVVRDKEENFIPSNSTLNKKNSNLFGSISNNFSEHLSIDYEFAIDNNFEIFEYNNFNTNIRFDKFETSLNLIEENGVMGDSNVFENTSKFTIDENNYVSFKTRRNRRIDLTEYYDLVYEYKNDCLTAGIKYKKTYYEDRDLKPSENVFFTITLYPLTTFEQKIDQQ